MVDVVTSHERLYREYRAVERLWRDANPERETTAREYFRRIVKGRVSEVDQAIELQYHEIRVPGEDGWRATRWLQSQFKSALRPEVPVYDDVYHAAIRMLAGGGQEWAPNPHLNLVFRGQRSLQWDVVPSLFRVVPDSLPLEARLHRLTHVVRYLQSQLSRPDDLEGVAIAQHYSHEAEVATWLLDITWDPFIALFFASDRGEDGDVGIVQKISRAEWGDLSAGGTNRLGAMQVVSASATRRIAAQRALFIDTAHPDFFEQIVPYDIRFRQHSGLVFEDNEHEVKVTRETLYPPDDEMLALLPPPAFADDHRPLDVAPAGDASRHLKGDDYFMIAASWIAAENIELDPYRRDTLRAICEVHARMQERRDIFTRKTRNIHRLRDAAHRITRAIEENRYPSVADALTFNTWAMNDVQREAFDELVLEVDR